MVDKQKIKICHLTSAHVRYDIRIFLKECCSLTKGNFNVHLVVADNKGDELIENVNIFDVGKLEGRINRFLKTSNRVYKKGLKLDCDIYHIHDPELIPYGLKLKRKGKKVIFDAHEDLPKQLKSKPYLSKFFRVLLPYIFEKYERYAFKKFDAILGATPYISTKISKINKNSHNINNFPIIGELDNNQDWGTKKNEICYVGGSSIIRGIYQIVDAMEFVKSDVVLNLVGGFNQANILPKLKERKGWERVNYHGHVGRDEVSKIMARSKAGIVTFLGVPNHIDAQPNKMFEYMSAGLPLIASNFPLWKDIVTKNKCGLTVDPKDSIAIAKTIDSIVLNIEESSRMGLNGKNAVLKKYNWQQEELKLINIYNNLIKL